MSTGTWLVLCARDRTIELAELAERLRGRKSLAHVELDGALVATVRDPLGGREARVTIGLSTEPHVALEAAELAGRHPDAPAHDRLTAVDARYELLWDLRDADEVYNALATIAGILEKACDGVIYDATAQRFVGPSPSVDDGQALAAGRDRGPLVGLGRIELGMRPSRRSRHPASTTGSAE